jgi:ribosomal protein S8
MNQPLSVAEGRELLSGMKGKKPSKYRSNITIVDKIKFDSKKESQRYLELTMLQRQGYISALQHQVAYELIVNDQLICRYVADFVYLSQGKQVVEDVKSEATRKNRAYRIKNKLMKALFGIQILET